MLTSGARRAAYAEFAAAAANVKLAEEPAIKQAKDWWLLGTDVLRLDIPHKVNGSAQYAIDTRLPGMVYAAVKAQPPASAPSMRSSPEVDANLLLPSTTT